MSVRLGRPRLQPRGGRAEAAGGAGGGRGGPGTAAARAAAAAAARGGAMAGKKKGIATLIKLVSRAGTGFFYVARKNPRRTPGKLQAVKYDPRVRRHVLFEESKMR